MRLQNIDNKKVECEEPCDGRLSSTVPREEWGETPRSYSTSPLSASDLLELKKIQRNVVGTPSYVKVTCVLMFAQGLSVQVISNSLGIDASTAYCYLNIYRSSGIDPLLGTRHKGY